MHTHAGEGSFKYETRFSVSLKRGFLYLSTLHFSRTIRSSSQGFRSTRKKMSTINHRRRFSSVKCLGWTSVPSETNSSSSRWLVSRPKSASPSTMLFTRACTLLDKRVSTKNISVHNWPSCTISTTAWPNCQPDG